MKQLLSMTLAALLAITTLAGCGSSADEAVAPSMSLDEFYAELATEYGWDELFMAEIEADIQVSLYPGIEDIDTVTVIARAPMMSAVVSELVLAECADADAATAMVAVLENRMATQAQGGAWYPSSMDAWGNAQVIQRGNYVALIASEGHQDDIAAKWDALFA